VKRNLFAELKRRNVIRTAVLYIGVVWALSQGAAQLLPVFDVPTWAVRWFIVAAIIGFPFWIAFAWFFEFTPEGLKRESEVEPHESITHHTGRKLDFAIIGVLAVAVVLLLTNTFVWHKGAGLSVDADSVPIAEHSIAVLPFVNMSDEKSNEYFSDGISEELLNLLAKIPQLQVTARTSSFSFKGKEVAIPEIARTLHVAHVLEGSVRKAGNSVRVTAQLIKAGTDTHLWSQTYDRKLDDIFKIQDEIAAAVVEQLKIKLLGETPTAKPVDGQAYALFLQARAVERQGSAEAFAQAIALYQQAVALDASAAAAWTGLAEVYCLQEYQYQRPADEATRLAREALERALASDPGYAPAHAQLGWIAIFLDRDLSAAARHLEHALTLDPGNTDVLGIAAILARRLGRFEQAVAIGRHLLAHDPVSPTGWDDLGYALLYAGHRDEAMAAFRKVLQLSPNFAGQHWNIAGLLAQEGDAATAMADAQQESDAQFRLYALTAAHFALGEKEKSDALFAEAIERYGATSSYSIGLLAALRGQTDLSFEWLDKALEHGEPDLGAIPAYPTFILLRSDPRWLPFLRKIGYAPEQLEKIEFKVTLPQAQGGAASSGANQ
jgi:TolB-like protein/Tfp pilus assembly protein PilF